MKTNFQTKLNEIAQIIYDKKGFNILAIDVRGVSTITDFLIIAEGNVERHSSAIANAIIEDQKSKNERVLHVEGLQEGDWIVLDYLDIMVHLFIPTFREKYQLERLFKDSKVVDLDINIERQVTDQ